MAELFEAVASWPTLGMVLLVFGFLPGTVLRLAVRCYPKGDPRRTELVNDLYIMKPIERPLWVVTQLETAIHEGIPARIDLRKSRGKGNRKSWHFDLAMHVMGMASGAGMIATTVLAGASGELSWWFAILGGPVGLAVMLMAFSGIRKSRKPLGQELPPE